MNHYRLYESSDLDFEGIVVYVMHDNNIFIKVHCDSGIDQPQLLFYQKDSEDPIWSIDANSFTTVLNEALEKAKAINS